MSCVTSTIVVPSALSSRNSASSSWVRALSCPNVGSSSTRIRGRVISAVPTDSRRFSPPDSRNGCTSALPVSPKRSSIAPTRSSISAGAVRRSRRPCASSSNTVCAMNWCSGFWKTKPMCAASVRGEAVAGSIPSTEIRPRGGVTTPASACTSVVLPAPFGPMIAVTEAASMSSSTSCSTTFRPRRTSSPLALMTGSTSAFEARTWLDPGLGSSVLRASKRENADRSSSAVRGSGEPGAPIGMPAARSRRVASAAEGSHAPRARISSACSRRIRRAGPSNAMRPEASSTIALVAISSAASRSCSTRIRARSSDPAMSASAAWTSAVPCGSRFAVGSSRIRTGDPVASAEAIASRCFPPPDSRSGFSARRSHRPIRRRAASARASTSATGNRRFSRANAASSSTDPVTICASGSWNTVDTELLSVAIGVVATSCPHTETLPETAASSECGMRPLSASASVDLPDPLGPSSSTTSPACTSNETSRTAGSLAPQCVIVRSRTRRSGAAGIGVRSARVA